MTLGNAVSLITEYQHTVSSARLQWWEAAAPMTLASNRSVVGSVLCGCPVVITFQGLPAPGEEMVPSKEPLVKPVT